MTAGRGTANRSLWTGVPSASTTSALPSMTSRSARRTGTMVSGSNEALRARQRTTRLLEKRPSRLIYEAAPYAIATANLRQVLRLRLVEKRPQFFDLFFD